MKKLTLHDKEVETCGLIANRDRSEVYKVIIDSVPYCWKILSDDERFNHTYERAYENYFNLKDKADLVIVRNTWRDEDGRFNVIMEWLDGYKRLEYSNRSRWVITKINAIEQDLIDQGYFMIDLAPINFMINGCKVKMIDLDTLAKLTDFPVDPHKMVSELSWYGSRILKHRSGRT